MLSCVQLFVIPRTAERQVFLSFTVSQSLLRFMAKEPSSPSPPAFSLSQQQGLFQCVSSSHQVAKVLQFFSFRISPSNKYSGLVSFRMDWLDLLAVQGTLKSLLQHHATVQKRQFFSAQHFIFLKRASPISKWDQGPRAEGILCLALGLQKPDQRKRIPESRNSLTPAADEIRACVWMSIQEGKWRVPTWGLPSVS